MAIAANLFRPHDDSAYHQDQQMRALYHDRQRAHVLGLLVNQPDFATLWTELDCQKSLRAVIALGICQHDRHQVEHSDAR